MNRVLFGCGVLLSSRVLFANAFWRAFWLIELRQPLLVETQPTLARRLKKNKQNKFLYKVQQFFINIFEHAIRFQ